ncbi:Ribosome-associated heat shock protein implicated in the recycling of the 50S subunit (S4 paralog) [hydrothermal vent metagenome]|uniref:Ribosome-associated heat shock protein implicated in the recycling of the 50S subunit (S4 paralog) n=1 Tax=hydrothermal vent metagenome TaxID=652676 RepID=A0A3B1APG7_9ZZZZ
MNIRLDKWLWAARFYKTRKLATEAVQGGHVHVVDQNKGSRVKPSRSLAMGETLVITKGLYQFTIEVLQLSDKRGSATIAQQLYQETAESIAQRETISLQRKAQNIAAPRKRPDKRERARIIRFKNKFAE